MLLRFFLGSAIAIAIALVGGYFALRSVAIDEAKRETSTKAQEVGQLVEATVGDGLLSGDAAAIAAVDDAVVARVLSDSVVRVKIWSADGSVLYSDDPAQIGGHYALDDDQLRLLREGGRPGASRRLERQPEDPSRRFLRSPPRAAGSPRCRHDQRACRRAGWPRVQGSCDASGPLAGELD